MSDLVMTTNNLKYVEPKSDGNDGSGQPVDSVKHNYGISALFGRTEQNVTFHPRGAHSEAKFDNAFPKAYFEIFKSAIKMVSLFFRSK